MKRDHDIVTVPVTLRHETEKAYLVDGGNGNVWLPKSECDFEDGELQLPEWLAIDKGLA